MNQILLQEEVQQFISTFEVRDVAQLAFKKSPFEGVSMGEVINQIKAREICRKKHPLIYSIPLIYFPTKRALEQSSSQWTAIYKSELVSGDSFIDITGGMGIDSYYFSKVIKTGTHCELDADLSAITSYNFKQLNALNINMHIGDGISYCENLNRPVDFIFIDPSRRNQDNSRKFFLNETEPNVIEHLELLRHSCKKLMIKTSPLLDLKKGIKQLKDVAEVHVVSFQNEVKELLWLWTADHRRKDVLIKAVDLDKSSSQVFEFDLNDEKQSQVTYGPIKKYIYEPSKAILKSGGFKLFSLRSNLTKINEHSHLYTSDELIKIQGRVFEVNEVSNYNKKQLKKKFGKQQKHIIKKNYPESVANIRKKTGILEGGKEFLIFTTNYKEKRMVIEAIPLFNV